MNWNKQSIVKDILAMANTLDGGRIVFGIEDDPVNRVGLTDDQLETFDQEVMKDQIDPYADPDVQFDVSIAEGQDGFRYIVLTIQPFTLLPVICSKGGEDVSAGRIYIRPRGGRPQSREVRSSAELRDILDRSIAANLRRYRELGIVADEDQENEVDEAAAFDAEIEDLA